MVTPHLPNVIELAMLRGRCRRNEGPVTGGPDELGAEPVCVGVFRAIWCAWYCRPGHSIFLEQEVFWVRRL